MRRAYTITRENALFFDNSFVVPDELLETGQQPLTMPGKLSVTPGLTPILAPGFTTMLDRMSVPAQRVGDSTGKLEEV